MWLSDVFYYAFDSLSSLALLGTPGSWPFEDALQIIFLTSCLIGASLAGKSFAFSSSSIPGVAQDSLRGRIAGMTGVNKWVPVTRRTGAARNRMLQKTLAAQKRPSRADAPSTSSAT